MAYPGVTKVNGVTQQPWGNSPGQWGQNAQWGAPFGQQPVQYPQPTQQQGSYPPPGQFSQPYNWPAPQPSGRYQRPKRRMGAFGLMIRVAVIIVVIMFGLAIIRTISGFVGGIAPTLPGGNSTAGNGTQYQNEGYQAPPADFDPPALPQPKTYSQATEWLNNNDIYGQKVASPTKCGQEPITSGMSKADMEDSLNAEVACLMTVWAPAIESAGFALPRPPVTVYNSPVTTACGIMKEVNAAYCAGDQHIYYAQPLLQALPSKVGDTKYAAEDVIAHEFGHTIQARTGILVSDKALEQRASSAEAIVMSRRTEQQADCFGGLYVASVAQSQGLSSKDLQDLVDMTYYLGDDALGADPGEGDHGTGRNRQIWFAKGLQTSDVNACNTWIVPASQVK